MRLIKFASIAFILLFAVQAQAKTTTIKGRIPQGVGTSIWLSFVDDYVSQKQVFQQKTMIDENHHFYMSFDIDKVTIARFKVDLYYADIILEPGKKYELEFDKIDLFKRINSINLQYPERLKYRIVNADKNDINALDMKLNQSLKSFDSTQLANYLRTMDYQFILELEKKLDKDFKGVSNEYITISKHYYLKRFQFNWRELSYKSIVNEEYDRFGNAYNNPYFLKFMEDAFGKYYRRSRKINIRSIHEAINAKGNYDHLNATLLNDSILKNEKLRELVCIFILKDVFKTPEFKDENILYMLRYIAQNSKFPEHRKIASNLASSFQSRYMQSTAFEFKFTDYKGNPLSLSDFRGQYIYVMFWSLDCQECLSELNSIDKLQKVFRNDIKFIGVNLDRNVIELNEFMKKKRYGFTNTNFKMNMELLQAYGIRSIPRYVLIGPDGKIVNNYAPAPSKNFSYYFKTLIGDND